MKNIFKYSALLASLLCVFSCTDKTIEVESNDFDVDLSYRPLVKNDQFVSSGRIDLKLTAGNEDLKELTLSYKLDGSPDNILKRLSSVDKPLSDLEPFLTGASLTFVDNIATLYLPRINPGRHVLTYSLASKYKTLEGTFEFEAVDPDAFYCKLEIEEPFIFREGETFRAHILTNRESIYITKIACEPLKTIQVNGESFNPGGEYAADKDGVIKITCNDFIVSKDIQTEVLQVSAKAVLPEVATWSDETSGVFKLTRKKEILPTSIVVKDENGNIVNKDGEVVRFHYGEVKPLSVELFKTEATNKAWEIKCLTQYTSRDICHLDDKQQNSVNVRPNLPGGYFDLQITSVSNPDLKTIVHCYQAYRLILGLDFETSMFGPDHAKAPSDKSDANNQSADINRWNDRMTEEYSSSNWDIGKYNTVWAKCVNKLHFTADRWRETEHFGNELFIPSEMADSLRTPEALKSLNDITDFEHTRLASSDFKNLDFEVQFDLVRYLQPDVSSGVYYGAFMSDDPRIQQTPFPFLYHSRDYIVGNTATSGYKKRFNNAFTLVSTPKTSREVVFSYKGKLSDLLAVSAEGSTVPLSSSRSNLQIKINQLEAAMNKYNLICRIRTKHGRYLSTEKHPNYEHWSKVIKTPPSYCWYRMENFRFVNKEDEWKADIPYGAHWYRAWISGVRRVDYWWADYDKPTSDSIEVPAYWCQTL